MPDPQPDVGQILPAARAGEPAAMGAVLEACRAYLLGIADRELDAKLRAKGGASDLVQETFLEAQRDFAGFHGDSEQELRAWLRRLLLNNLSNFARHYRRTDKRRLDREVGLGPTDSAGHTAPVIPADTLTPSGHMMADEQQQALRDAMRRLPEDYRVILTLRYQDELSFEEIGERMQRTSNAVRKLWSRAVERLQEELDADPKGNE